SYDGIPKSPEWASELTGTPAEDIVWYAHAVGKQNNVSLLHGYAAARTNCSEDFPQLFMTIGAMGGHIGKPGNSCGSAYHANAGDDTGRYPIVKGSTGEKLIPNAMAKYAASVPEIYTGILEGTISSYDPYDLFAKGVKDENLDPSLLTPGAPVDIHVIVHAYRNFLQTSPGTKEGIEAMRKVDFIVDIDYDFNLTAQYSDIILPASTKWERFEFHNYLGYTREHIAFHDQVIEPLFESKSDQRIGSELASRMGLDPAEVYPATSEQLYINFIASTTVLNDTGADYETLVSISQEEADDIRERYGAEAPVQEGRISFSEIMEKGIYSFERHQGDAYGNIGYKAFVDDPEANPLKSKSGKFEIYCQDKADALNTIAAARKVTEPTFKPYPMYRPSEVLGYEDPQREKFPYQVFNPHYLRRSHTEFDNVEWLRASFPNPVFLNAADAAEKGIIDGDTVVLTNPAGAQALRQASITERLMPKTIALPHGAWSMIDENGVDTGGGDNYLLMQKSSVSGVSGYNTLLVDIDIYTGEGLEPDWKKIPAAPDFAGRE
ncbi:MAG: molybdopterin dinucleotide binding domain-containing protein, partial [Raoultibacter sp.]